jgi:glycine dehydrogenase subunit 1
MKFIPNSDIKNEMLKEIGLKKIDDLFSDIPTEIKIDDLDLPIGLSQMDAEKKLAYIASKNKSCSEVLCFLGGGIKPHYVPAAVKSLISRSEFLTAYTPYQSEASQGFLQAMFEYQSMIAELTGMDIANCSLYDGVTAVSEAALMSTRVTRKKKFVIPNSISYDKKSVLKNYLKGPGIELVEVSYDDKTGKINLEDLKKIVDKATAGIYIENPNFFGVFEDDIKHIKKTAEEAGALLVLGVDPVSLGVIKSPGEYGADIVVGEGRAFGNPLDFGGSGLGIFACKKEYIRQIPGRIIGMTNDSQGNRAFCMSMQTREQHIRRARATSNICTNEGLCALSACIYMSLLGGRGLQMLSKTNFKQGQKLEEMIVSLDGFEKRFNSSHFNEFVIKSSKPSKIINKKLLENNIQGGLLLNREYPELKNCMLFGVTEIHTEDDMKKLVSILEEV